MHRAKNSDPIPVHLIHEILVRSSAKSIATFRLASKFCASIVGSPDFTELFLTRSRARPRLLFALEQDCEWSFYSSSNPDDHSSLVVAADTQMKTPGRAKDMRSSEKYGPVSGLIYFPNMQISKREMTTVPVIYNPSTGQYRSLPKPATKYSRSFLGYDPIDKRFKVLSMMSPLSLGFGEENQILTLGSGKMSWRKVECGSHDPISEGICINGVVYYLALTCDDENPSVMILACFDVRSEKLWFIPNPSSSSQLINYKGKLGVISSEWYHHYFAGSRNINLCLWVLEDVEKQEWSKHDFSVRKGFGVSGSVAGVTPAGEIVLARNSTDKRFYVFYFNPEKDTMERVEVQGFEASKNGTRVHTFMDYVEDHKFI